MYGRRAAGVSAGDLRIVAKASSRHHVPTTYAEHCRMFFKHPASIPSIRTRTKRSRSNSHELRNSPPAARMVEHDLGLGASPPCACQRRASTQDIHIHRQQARPSDAIHYYYAVWNGSGEMVSMVRMRDSSRRGAAGWPGFPRFMTTRAKLQRYIFDRLHRMGPRWKGGGASMIR